MTRSRPLLLLTLLALALAACGQSGPAEPQPPEIAYGLDACAACGMLIDSPQFAAASLTTGGQALKFDDIGDMLVYHQEHPEQQVRAWFVHDYESEAWIRAETAYFVQSSHLHTPMAHGLVAFAQEADAQALADSVGATVLSFDFARAAMIQMDHAAHN
jgi:copper chaperone NosL